MKYTLRIVNGLMGSALFRGTYASEEEARAAADTTAARVRSFCTIEVWSGTPQAPSMFVRYSVKGSA